MTKITIAPTVFIVNPINDLQGYLDLFEHDKWLKRKYISFKTKSSAPMLIQLVQGFFGTIDSIRYELNEEGYICASSPHLLGMAIKYASQLREYSSITAMDTENLMIDKNKNGAVINIRPSLQSKSFILDLCSVNGTLNGNGWIPVYSRDGLSLT